MVHLVPLMANSSFHLGFIPWRRSAARPAVLGLQPNLPQFILLVLINALVGGMLGLERSAFVGWGQDHFHTRSTVLLLGFIVAFGMSKAFANLVSGIIMEVMGRKYTLILGWVLAWWVPLMLFWANSWWTIIAVNVLLGFSQGLTWSATVIMKVDLVGKDNRGLAMGWNEFAGYGFIALFAYLSHRWLEHWHSLLPLVVAGLVLASVGLLLSAWLVKDTSSHVTLDHPLPSPEGSPGLAKLAALRHKKNTVAITQAGLMNNLIDGLVWGLFPLYLHALELPSEHIARVVATYPLVWGLGQLFTGKWGDRFPPQRLLVLGMTLQGVLLLGMPLYRNTTAFWWSAVGLGLGTALVYPNFLTAVANANPASVRTKALSVFRFWRDLGYVMGALLAGIIADWVGMELSFVTVGGLTLLSTIWLIRNEYQNKRVT